jgi:hypothetical protein
LARRRVGLLTPALCFHVLDGRGGGACTGLAPQSSASTQILDASTSSKLLDVFLLAKGSKPRLSHPAALRKGMRMGSDSPEQLHNSLVLHYYLIIASLLLHYYCISTVLLLYYYSITTDFYYINSALLPLCI